MVIYLLLQLKYNAILVIYKNFTFLIPRHISSEDRYNGNVGITYSKTSSQNVYKFVRACMNEQSSWTYLYNLQLEKSQKDP